jgi:L-lactate dehydrogenase (cytochrome)
MFVSNKIHTYEDARRLARRRLPRLVFDYIEGAAGTGHGEALNLEALASVRLQPRVLVNVSERDLSVPLFDTTAGLPFGTSPMAMCNLAAPGADRQLAALSARHRVPLGVSTISSTPLEQLIELAEGHAWFQLYFSGDGTQTLKLLDRAHAAGYRHLVLTLDVPEVARRPRDERSGFKIPFRIGPRQFIDFALHPRWSLGQLAAGKPEMANFRLPGYSFDRTASRGRADWNTFRALRERWPGKLIAKGVSSVDDALQLQREGADAIQVSSHGGRQLDAAPPPILQLRAIRQTLGPGFPLFYDTGLRSGEDVVKAYALGADFVFFGRAMQYAVAGGGERGLAQWWALLAEDISNTLAQLGRTSLRDASTCLA